jgi:hypothetical protein
MKYRIIHKKTGVKSFDIYSEFEHNTDIKDICFIKDIGFLCLGLSSIIVITPQLCREVVKIDNPMSICKGNEQNIYVAYNNGIKSIDYLDRYVSTDILGSSECYEIFGRLHKIGTKDIYIDQNGGKIGIAIRQINKAFVYNRNSIEKTYGNGMSEYSVSNKINNCSFSNPSGIIMYNSDTIFISDYGNGCIRSFGKNHRVIVGDPINKFLSPSKLAINKKRNSLYYLNLNCLRNVNVDGSRDVILYEGSNVKSFALTDEDKAFVLEEIK